MQRSSALSFVTKEGFLMLRKDLFGWIGIVAGSIAMVRSFNCLCSGVMNAISRVSVKNHKVLQ
jgi:hypothetical protein